MLWRSVLREFILLKMGRLNELKANREEVVLMELVRRSELRESILLKKGQHNELRANKTEVELNARGGPSILEQFRLFRIRTDLTH